VGNPSASACPLGYGGPQLANSRRLGTCARCLGRLICVSEVSGGHDPARALALGRSEQHIKRREKANLPTYAPAKVLLEGGGQCTAVYQWHEGHRAIAERVQGPRLALAHASRSSAEAAAHARSSYVGVMPRGRARPNAGFAGGPKKRRM